MTSLLRPQRRAGRGTAGRLEKAPVARPDQRVEARLALEKELRLLVDAVGVLEMDALQGEREHRLDLRLLRRDPALRDAPVPRDTARPQARDDLLRDDRVPPAKAKVVVVPEVGRLARLPAKDEARRLLDGLLVADADGDDALRRPADRPEEAIVRARVDPPEVEVLARLAEEERGARQRGEMSPAVQTPKDGLVPTFRSVVKLADAPIALLILK